MFDTGRELYGQRVGLIAFEKYLCSVIQQIIIAFIFLAALFYIARMVLRSFNTKEGCEKDCKCGVAGDTKIAKVKPS